MNSNDPKTVQLTLEQAFPAHTIKFINGAVVSCDHEFEINNLDGESSLISIQMGNNYFVANLYSRDPMDDTNLEELDCSSMPTRNTLEDVILDVKALMKDGLAAHERVWNT